MTQKATSMDDKQMAEIYAKTRKKNVIMLVSLLVFVFSLVALSFVIRINYIKGLAD